MKKTELIEVIKASKEKTWDVLFNQYGAIHVHNPNMESSHYMNNATKGELNCVRYCDFDGKLNLEEIITDVNEFKSVSMEVTTSNLPFVKGITATYDLVSKGNGVTELKMTSEVITSPRFMIYLMKGQMNKALKKHLFGMKYFIETGNIANKENYSKVFKRYK